MKPSGKEKLEELRKAKGGGDKPSGKIALESLREKSRIKKMGALEQLGRQLGLTARAVGEGVADLGGIFSDPLTLAINKGLEALGADYQLMPASEAMSDVLTDAGLPAPVTGREKVVNSAGRAAVAAGLTMGGGAVSGTKSGATLAEAPLAQLMGAESGGAAAELARQQGVGPAGQAAASLAGGIAGGGAASVASGIANTTGRMLTGSVRPFTRGGQEDIAASVLRSQATDADAAAQRLANSQEVVPGSVPTTGAASGDVGLLGLEKAVRTQSREQFGDRLSEQNLARQRALDDIAGDEADIVAAKQQRDVETSAMRDAAFENAGSADVSPVVGKIDEILASPKGKRTAVNQALSDIRQQLDGVSNPEELYAIRQNIGDMMSGKVKGEKSNLKLARSQLIDVRESLDNAIESVAPGFKAYLSRYRERSKPIDQMEVLQEIRKRGQLASSSDIQTGREFLSTASFKRAVRSADKKGDLKVLTPAQRETLNAVAADLELGGAISSSLLRAPGSDTMQNISAASMMSAMIGREASDIHPLFASLVRPINWLYRLPDEKITEILTEAMLDPRTAQKLLQKPRPKTMRALSIDLRRKARGLGIGSSVASATTPRDQQRQSEGQ